MLTKDKGIEKMSENIITTVLNITGRKEDDIIRLKIEAKLNEILSYLNRDDITEEMFPVICMVIAECINSEALGDNIQSLKEGDMSVTYSNTSPFFGRLESFKVIRGIN